VGLTVSGYRGPSSPTSYEKVSHRSQSSRRHPDGRPKSWTRASRSSPIRAFGCATWGQISGVRRWWTWSARSSS
jgi:hypothetical protein